MTYIYQRMSAADITRELLADEYAGWNYEQAAALAKYLIEYAESTGEPLKFDRVAVRCDFAAYDSALDAAQEYDLPFECRLPFAGEAAAGEAAAREYLEANTTLIQCADGSIVIQQF